MKIILILSAIKYHDMKQRPQHIAEFFSKKGYKVLYLGLSEEKIILSSDIFNSLTINDLMNTYSKNSTENIFVLKRIYRSTNPQNKNLNDIILKISNEINTEGLTILVEHPEWMDHLDNIPTNTKLVYDCLDDWEGFVTDLNFGMEMNVVNKERKLASIADLVIASAKRLYNKMCLYNKNVYYLPNGVWNKDYKFKEIDRIPEDLRNIKKPIVFFMGGIANWIDINLISYLATQRPNYAFVFVGETIDCKLPNNSNIHFLGKKKYDDLPLYLKRAKVAIIPFKTTNLTASVTPLKFYEYCSAGVPVVSTMLPDLLHLNGCKVVSSYKEFLDGVDYYINLDDYTYKNASLEALETADDFDWNNLLRPLCSFLENKEFGYVENEQFIINNINSYKLYRENNIIKNELLNSYNNIGLYDDSLNLYKWPSIKDGELDLDYNQLALAYIKCNLFEKALELIKNYINNNSKVDIYAKYYLGILCEHPLSELLLEAFVLKLCNRHSEALSILDVVAKDDLVIAMIAQLYLELNENNLFFSLMTQLINSEDDLKIFHKLDPNSVLELIDMFLKEKDFGASENCALKLYELGAKDIAIQKMGQIYLLREMFKVEEKEFIAKA